MHIAEHHKELHIVAVATTHLLDGHIAKGKAYVEARYERYERGVCVDKLKERHLAD
jgi:hypothetical protein